MSDTKVRHEDLALAAAEAVYAAEDTATGFEVPDVPLDAATLEACFDLAYQTKRVDVIFRRVFG